MSKEAVHLFIKKIEQDEKLQEIVQNWYKNPDSGINLTEIGREHGFEFTKQEGLEIWNQMQKEEELPDFALELIAGGSSSEEQSTEDK